MADKISGYGRVGLDVSGTRARAVSRPGHGGGPDGAGKSREGRDAVEITDTATRLKAAEARLSDVPDVDRARVAAIRQRVESGQYQPDAARTAAKLLQLEQDLT